MVKWDYKSIWDQSCENLGDTQCDLCLKFATKQEKGMNSIVKLGP